MTNEMSEADNILQCVRENIVRCFADDTGKQTKAVWRSEHNLRIDKQEHEIKSPTGKDLVNEKKIKNCRSYWKMRNLNSRSTLIRQYYESKQQVMKMKTFTMKDRKLMEKC